MLLAALSPLGWLASRPTSQPGSLSPSSAPLTRLLRMEAPLPERMEAPFPEGMEAPFPEGMEEDVTEGTPDEDAATAAASADFTVAVAAMAGMTALGVDLMTLNGELGLLGVAVTSTPPHPPPHARPPTLPPRAPHAAGGGGRGRC